MSDIHKEDRLIQAVVKTMNWDMMNSEYAAIAEMFECLLDGKDPKETLVGFLPDPILEELEENRFKTIW